MATYLVSTAHGNSSRQSVYAQELAEAIKKIEAMSQEEGDEFIQKWAMGYRPCGHVAMGHVAMRHRTWAMDHGT